MKIVAQLVDAGGFEPACSPPVVDSLAEIPGQICALLSECPPWALWLAFAVVALVIALVMRAAYWSGYHNGFNLGLDVQITEMRPQAYGQHWRAKHEET